MSANKSISLLIFLSVISNILALAPRIDQNPMGVIVVNISDPVTLECRASGEPRPIITWFKNGIALNVLANNRYTLIRNSDLFIVSARVGRGERSDSGVYYCIAKNEHGEARSSNASLLVTFLKDDFREIPKSRQINSGSEVNMECIAPRGSPEPIIWWEKNGMPLRLDHHHHRKSESSYESFDNGTFSIRNASLVDNGEYRCVAQNDAGIRKSAPAYLNVFEKPSFLIKPETAKHEVNTQVQFECEANGFPKPLIEWKKDNSIDNIPLKAQIRDNTLIIPNVDLEDEGEYTCLASNQLGSVESKSYLIVYEKPVFTKVMSNLTIGIESKSLTIECNARGKPQPLIYWAKSGQLPSANGNGQTAGHDDFIILENGNLFIESLSKKYEGTYLCQASNEYGSIETKTNLMVKSVQSKPPPIIVYGPQNQTIPINTQAILECLTTTASNVLFNDFSKNSPQELQSQYLSNEKVQVYWYKNGEQINTHYDSIKYKIRDTGSLEINSVQSLDSGVYYCSATNLYGKTNSVKAFLNVENPNNQYAEFQRNYETTALPSAPTQPVILLATATSVSLSWQPSSHSGHSPLLSYTIEFFSPEWPESLPGWKIAAKNIPAISSYTIENLQPDTYYMFMVRARNTQGFGPPSQVSDLSKTLFEPQSIYQNKNSNEILERALTGEVVILNEPAHVLSSTSISITWKILKSASLIEGFYIKYKPIGAKSPYEIITINDKYKKSAVLVDLNKFTPYEILVEPFSGPIRGSESNVLQAKTLEDIPSKSPVNLSVELDSVTSMSIKWQSPPLDHMNGVILGYKISCIANETKFSLNLNTNSTTRAIIVGNLIKDMRYCVQVAAFTRKGTGPFTVHKCIEMSNSFLSNLEISKNPLDRKNIQEALNEPWLIAIIVIISIIIISLLFYCVYFVFKRLIMSKKQHKFLSTSSENASLNGPHKIDNGNRYKLVNDNIWMDTLHSGSNHSNQECCCVPDLHHQIFVQNPAGGNRHLIHEPSHDQSMKSKFHTDSCTQHTNSTNTNSNNSSQQPQYAEIYGPSIQQLQHQLQQGNANPYATSGLFVNGELENHDVNSNNTSHNNPYNIINYQTMGRQIPNVSAYTIKMLTDKIQNDVNVPNNIGNATTLSDQKKLLKYLQHSTQSQTNTPRVPAKNLQNRVKSENHTNNFCTMHHPHQANEFIQQRFTMQQPMPPQPPQIPHQMITYLSDNGHQESMTNEVIRNFLEQIPNPNQQTINALLQQQQQQMNQQNQQQHPNSSSTPIPSLPVVPPPSLASALLAQQNNHAQLTQHQQKQLIEGYNNLLNTISRTQQQQSPVQYNMPWNGVGEHKIQNSAFTSGRMVNQNQSNASSLISSLTGQSTLSRAQQQSTFTSQQYANRQQDQVQQDYSSISPVEDMAEAELERLEYNKNQLSQNAMINNNNQRNMPMNTAHSWASVGDTNSNAISSSYESQNHQNLSHSLNSSDMSASKRSTSRSDDDIGGHGNQHYANHDLGNSNYLDEKKGFQPILIKNTGDSNEVYMSEMPQTIL